jgi:ribosomal protein S18 acetylase RimI-like enzyme
VETVRLERARLGEASEMLARAFQRRARLLPWLFRVGFDVTAADVWATAGPVLGAARWMPPGRPAMRIGPTLRALVTTPLRLGSALGPFLSYGGAVEALRAEAMPGRHWYLAGIGVDPSAQRQGVGSALLQPGLAAAAQDGVPAVLLTNSAVNLPFYEGHGFEVVREGSTPENGPHAWAMVKWP